MSPLPPLSQNSVLIIDSLLTNSKTLHFLLGEVPVHHRTRTNNAIWTFDSTVNQCTCIAACSGTQALESHQAIVDGIGFYLL